MTRRASSGLVADAEAEIVIHQLTAFGTQEGDPLAETIRVRIEGTRSLVAAARAAGAQRFIAQSISFVCSPAGQGLTDEETPLYLDAPPALRPLAQSVASLERQTLEGSAPGVVLTAGSTAREPLMTRPMPFRAPSAREGCRSSARERGRIRFINLRDAALATTKALGSTRARESSTSSTMRPRG